MGEDQPQRHRFPDHPAQVIMALVAFLTLPLAWVANHARIQGRALSAISRAGGFVIYGFQRSPDGIILGESTPDPARNGSAATCPRITIAISTLSPSAAHGGRRRARGDKGAGASRGALPRQRRDYGCRAGPPAGLKHLKVLNLNGTQVTDAGLVHLAGLRELCYLNLSGTRVTDAGMALSRACGSCGASSSTGRGSPTPASPISPAWTSSSSFRSTGPRSATAGWSTCGRTSGSSRCALRRTRQPRGDCEAEEGHAEAEVCARSLGLGGCWWGQRFISTTVSHNSNFPLGIGLAT